MKRIRIGIAGCGQIAMGVHIPVLQRTPGVEIAALAECDEVNLQSASKRVPSAATFRDSHELTANGTIDALLICLPNHLHAEIATEALNAGKHVYVEKPVGVTLEEAAAVVRAWKRAHLVAMSGFNYRYNKLYGEVRRLIGTGTLGKIATVRTIFSLPPHRAPEWKRLVGRGGGALFDLGSHHIDLMHYFFDCGVRTLTASTDLEHGDSATLDLEMANGVRVQSFFSLSAGEEDRIEVYGDEGRLSVNRHLSLHVPVGKTTHQSVRMRQAADAWRALRHVSYLVEKRRAPAFEPSYGAALREFIAAIAEGRGCRPDVADGYRSLVVVRAALQSAATGRRLDLPAYYESPAG